MDAFLLEPAALFGQSRGDIAPSSTDFQKSPTKKVQIVKYIKTINNN